MWDLIVKVPDHCLFFFTLLYISKTVDDHYSKHLVCI